MAKVSATEWLAVLEAIAGRPPDEANAEWEWLMYQLGVGPEYFLAIYAAIQQGRWRAANNPKAYLKTVAKREASKIDAQAERSAELVFPGEIECDGEEISQEERLDSMQHELDSIWKVDISFAPDQMHFIRAGLNGLGLLAGFLAGIIGQKVD